ncbi:DUF2625 domain-containing protein [Dactylosporangium matsuzakiense]|uniref:DUF2625 family protein n=1 Tax=Dactylosporangium matsuzakiense TaxID=53360 RepID=A0A9W6KHJ2_9ACTN|nr:DUF2625 domain-containing protein [Dactylosporangium matsuzakiense]GLL00679.1 hypothetical protein GCM10017581_024200 [Dactylosporangium matsuzakiense]
MRSLAELISDDRSVWAEIEAAVSRSPYAIELLPADPDRAAACLHRLQVATTSWLGALVYRSGGLIVDGGWLRVLGSGRPSRRLADIHEVNELFDAAGMVVAQDVLGGEFVWRQGEAQGEVGARPTIHYFAPDTLGWEDLTLGYTDWLYAMLTGAADRFYHSWRWPGWRDEVAACPLDTGIHTVPPLFSKECRDLDGRSRRPVAMTQLLSVKHDMADRLGI